MKNHPRETDLALLASNDCGLFETIRLRRHVRNCARCQSVLESFSGLRGAMNSALLAAELGAELGEGAWQGLAQEMRANIRLGLEAGACVRERGTERPVVSAWQPRLALAMASLLLLAGAGFWLREKPGAGVSTVTVVPAVASPLLASSDAGIEFRSGETSLMLLNRNGAPGNQTVSAQGEIRSRYIDGDTGAVTINNVYLQ